MVITFDDDDFSDEEDDVEGGERGAYDYSSGSDCGSDGEDHDEELRQELEAHGRALKGILQRMEGNIGDDGDQMSE